METAFSTPVRCWLRLVVFLAALRTVFPFVSAAVIHVTPHDTWHKIESAQAGDEVVIAPGIYRYRLFLTNRATPAQPIVIRAEDPQHPPIWDFAKTRVEDAPGSYRGGDRGRGGWMFSGASGYRVSGVVFQNCRSASHQAAGVRYYNHSTDLYLQDCVFRRNDNGLAGGSQQSEATVEFCEFDRNGSLHPRQATHNVYIYGGHFTLRYSYVHDAVQGQNFHIRAQQSTLEYNWFARANAYEGDLMTVDDPLDGKPITQNMLLRGNLFWQKKDARNHVQMFVLHNDYRRPHLTLSVRAIANTVVGNGGSAAFIRLSNSDGQTKMIAELANNIISGTTRAVSVNQLIPPRVMVTGENNWLPSRSQATFLKNTLFSTSPGFRDAVQGDFTLAPGSICLGAASAHVADLPAQEYFQNEKNGRRYRLRTAARDLGAWESTTTGPGIGPSPRPRR